MVKTWEVTIKNVATHGIKYDVQPCNQHQPTKSTNHMICGVCPKIGDDYSLQKCAENNDSQLHHQIGGYPMFRQTNVGMRES